MTGASFAAITASTIPSITASLTHNAINSPLHQSLRAFSPIVKPGPLAFSLLLRTQSPSSLVSKQLPARTAA